MAVAAATNSNSPVWAQEKKGLFLLVLAWFGLLVSWPTFWPRFLEALVEASTVAVAIGGQSHSTHNNWDFC